MTAFRWSAISTGGDVISGITEAADRSTIVDRLQRQGNVVLRAELSHRQVGWAAWLQLDITKRRRLDAKKISQFTRELAIMLEAGQDLDRALRYIVENTENSRGRNILGSVRDRVRGGSSLASALAGEPQAFSRFYIGLVRAGEAGGTLPETLNRLAGLLEREQSLNANLRAALVYPALLVIAAGISIFFLLDYVLPQFQPIFEQAGAQLPTATRMLMTVGRLAGSAGPWVLAVVAIAAVVGRRLATVPAIRLHIDHWLLRLPIAGQLMKETIAARLTRTLGGLLQNGVALIPALAIAKEAVGNLAATQAIETAALAVKGGTGLSGPLEATNVFPPRTIHLLRLGEEAARLSEMALKAADIHDEQARLMMQRLVALAVPVITILMGLAVAGIVGALVTAMLSLNDLAG